jgi:hypothetical protein
MSRYNNHYTEGFELIEHKGKRIATSVTSPRFENFVKSLQIKSYKVGYIPAGYEHRADLISDLFYNTPTYDWLICYANNISDPFNQLNLGDRILIPNI